MTKLHQAAELGQAIWLDYIRREFIESGELQKLIGDGLRGITSNPSIFKEAMADSTDYDDRLPQLFEADMLAEEIYEELAIEDVRQAADLLRPVYDQTNGLDGYVSLEANPELAYDVEATLEEVRYLFETVDRPNVMIKAPGTSAGIPAIATLIGEGININVTLLFSLTNYEMVADAYIRGLERLADRDGDLSRIASVASFFVSRVDTAVDKKLDEIIDQGYQRLADQAGPLKGKIGIANAKMAYARYLTIFSSERWRRLEAKGARPQRLLWGSTSIKSPDYPDTLYVDNLMGANTVNTVPRSTLEALLDHGTISSGLTAGLDEARTQLNRLAQLGIDLELITQQLQDEGVIKFAESFAELLESLDEKRERLQIAQPA